MPLRYAQVGVKAEVMKEIAAQYLPNPDGSQRWRLNNFNFTPPSEHWLKAFPALAVFEVELRLRPDGQHKFDVLIIGKKDGHKTMANVGTITET